MCGPGAIDLQHPRGLLVIRGQIAIGLIVAVNSGRRQIDDHWGELLDFYRRHTDARVK